MQNTVPRPGPRWIRAPGANQAFKDRWSDLLRHSLMAAAAVHVAVFAMWPTQQVELVERDAPAMVLPAIRMATEPSAAHLLARADRPPTEPQRVAITPPDPQVAEQRRIERMLAEMVPPPPTVADPAPRLVVDTRLAEGPAIAFASHPANTQRSFTWPDIRNPRDMIRYFRSHYNPIHAAVVGHHSVSVALWVNERGVVEWSELHESSGISAIDRIALAAIQEVVEFTPAHRNGVPIAVGVVLSIPFQVRW